MPFKNAEDRRVWFRKYLAEWREGRRRGDGEKAPASRTVKARASAEKKRKRLWFLQNKEWCLQQQRERRRAAKAAAERELLRDLPVSSGPSSKPAKPGKNKPRTKGHTRS